MRKLATEKERVGFLAARSIGDRMMVTCDYVRGGDGEVYESDTFGAQVLEQEPFKTVVLVENDEPGGQVITLASSDGESTMTVSTERHCWYSVAIEQPGYDEADIAYEAAIEAMTAPVKGPGTQVQVNGARPVSWFLEEAKLLDDEADRYEKYSPPHLALTDAAKTLRSAVGHVMAGGHEKKRAEPAPF